MSLLNFSMLLLGIFFLGVGLGTVIYHDGDNNPHINYLLLGIVFCILGLLLQGDL